MTYQRSIHLPSFCSGVFLNAVIKCKAMQKLSIFSRLFAFTVAIFILFLLPLNSLKAQDCGADLQCQIDAIQREIDALSPAHEKNKTELASLKKQVDDLTKRISSLSSQLKSLEAQISGREEDLAYAQEIFEQKTGNHYKFLRLYDPIMPFLASADASEAFREINFRQRAADEDRKVMDQYAEDLIKLKTDKESFEKNK